MQSLLAELTVLGAAPRPLTRFVARVYTSPGRQGLTVAMRNGLLVYFGDADAAAREVAVARTGAGRLDLGGRRPISTCACPNAPPRASPPRRSLRPLVPTATAGQQATTPESTVAALAAGLTEDTNGEPAASQRRRRHWIDLDDGSRIDRASGAAESSTGATGTTATGEPETPAASATPGG